MSFLQEEEFEGALGELRSHTASAEAFRKRFFRWFDGFRAMKFIHHARDKFYGPGEVEMEAARLWEEMTVEQPPKGVGDLLLRYRDWERGGSGPLDGLERNAV
jgi:hypothetical protein